MGDWRGTWAVGRPIVGAAVVASALLVALPGGVSAHVLGGRVSSSLSLAAYMVITALCVGFAFVAVGLVGPDTETDPRAGLDRTVPYPVRLLLRLIGLAGWAWIVVQVVAGGVNGDADVASLFLWTYGWVALPVLCALLGPAWAWLDPFSTLFDLCAWALRRFPIGRAAARPYPARLGAWPAVACMVVLVWLELVVHLVAGHRLGLVVIGYTCLTLVGMAQYGKDAWRSHGELFSVWFGLLGRLAPYQLVGSPEEGDLRRRPFGYGLTHGTWTIDLVALVAIAIASFLYDGASQTAPFLGLFGNLGTVAQTALLAAFLLVFVSLVLGVARRAGRAAVGAALVPVAIGTLVAHYGQAFVLDAQRIVVVVSDPLQVSSILYVPGIAWLPTTAAWTLQMSAVVVASVYGAWTSRAAAQWSTGWLTFTDPGPGGAGRVHGAAQCRHDLVTRSEPGVCRLRSRSPRRLHRQLRSRPPGLGRRRCARGWAPVDCADHDGASALARHCDAVAGSVRARAPACLPRQVWVGVRVRAASDGPRRRLE